MTSCFEFETTVSYRKIERPTRNRRDSKKSGVMDRGLARLHGFISDCFPQLTHLVPLLSTSRRDRTMPSTSFQPILDAATVKSLEGVEPSTSTLRPPNNPPDTVQTMRKRREKEKHPSPPTSSHRCTSRQQTDSWTLYAHYLTEARMSTNRTAVAGLHRIARGVGEWQSGIAAD
jgi:hypothetical protein